MTETTVRKIREDELDKLIELYKHLHADDATLPERGVLVALWQNILSNPMLHYLVIEMDYQLVSFSHHPKSNTRCSSLWFD